MKTLVIMVLLSGFALHFASAQERERDRDRGETGRDAEEVYRNEDVRGHERGRTERAERRRDGRRGGVGKREKQRRDGADRRESRRGPTGVLDEILGARRAAIPAGHYPPPGECRVWHPDRPAGHQPPPEPCHRLRGRALGGAFIVYGGHAYDADYDWEREAARRRSVPNIIIDILRSRR